MPETNLPDTIDGARFTKAAAEAYLRVMQYVARHPMRSRPGYWLLDMDNSLMRDLTRLYEEAVAFAQTNGVPHVVPIKLMDGHASWLMVRKQCSIGVDFVTLAQWKEKLGIPKRVQAARCILHEMGHVFLQPQNLKRVSGDMRGLIASVNPEDEAEAWAFAFAALGLIVGDYACIVRCGTLDQPRGKDDSPSATV